MREQGFLNGDPHGHCVVYDQRGRIVQEMDYKQGRLDGVMTMYGIDGRVLKTITYEDGVGEESTAAGSEVRGGVRIGSEKARSFFFPIVFSGDRSTTDHSSVYLHGIAPGEWHS